MADKGALQAVSIVLVSPRYPENVGSVARAMKNMGLERLVIVDGCSPLHAHAYKLASGAEDLLERAEEFPTLKEAVAEMGFVVGMTSRGGKERCPLLSPKTAVKKLIPLASRNRVAMVFGSEKEGLTNPELSLCNMYVRIPSSDDFPSRNLAHAVAVICYELFLGTNGDEKEGEPLAAVEQMEAMYAHMERTLVDIDFLEANRSKRIMWVLRKLLGRSQMNEREVQILQGIWSQVDRQIRKKQGPR